MKTLLKILDYILRGPFSILPKIYQPLSKPASTRKTLLGTSAKYMQKYQDMVLRDQTSENYEREADLLYRRLARQLSWYPKDTAEYIDLLYYTKQALGDSVELDELKAIALAANTLDQYKQGKINDDLVDDLIRQLNLNINEVKSPSREERIKEYSKQIKKLLDNGNINKDEFYKQYSRLSTLVEYALMKYDNIDFDKILDQLAISSKSPIEYRSKVHILEEIIKDLDEKQLIKPGFSKNINLKLIKPVELPHGWSIGRYLDPVRISLKYYESIAKKYAHIVSIPKRRARLPLELSEHGRWKPWRDDISSLNIYESFIRGNGKFIWGVTTVKNLPIKFKSYYEDIAEDYRVGVSIDVSGSTGYLTGLLTNVIEYELVLALAIYYFSTKNNIPVVLHFWSDDDRILEIRGKISRFPDKLIRTIEPIVGGGTNPELVYRIIKDEKYFNLFWIIFTDLDWPFSAAEKWLSYLRSLDKKNMNICFIIFYDETYIGYEPTYPYICVYKRRLYKNDPVCSLLEFIRNNMLGEMYIITSQYDTIVKTILRKIREMGLKKNYRVSRTTG